MTDRLGEALADYWTTNNGNRSYKADVAIYEAARSWHALTNPTVELIERLAWIIGAERSVVDVVNNDPGPLSRITARKVIDALSDTPTTEENPPQDFVND